MSAGQTLIMQHVLEELKSLLSAVTVDGKTLSVHYAGDREASQGLVLWLHSVRSLPQELRGEQVVKIKGAKGEEEEVLSAPPALYALSVGVAPVTGAYPEMLAGLGAVLQRLQDQGNLDVGPYGWIGLKDAKIALQVVFDDPSVREAAAALVAPQGAGLAFGVRATVGVNSAQIRPFKRVSERKVSAEPKTPHEIEKNQGR